MADEPSKQAYVALLGKIRDVANEIGFFEKRGRNDFHEYNYVQAADVTRVVRDKLLERHILMIAGAQNVRHEPVGSGSLLTTVDLRYEFIDTETGHCIVIPWVGVGVDKGGDKGLYKAFTGGLKYALMTLLMVPSTDDPERDHLTERDTKAHKDDLRPAAPTIPRDRALSILKQAVACGLATLDLDAPSGTPPVIGPLFRAALALHGVERITDLNVDQAEAVEAFIRNETEGAQNGD